MYVRVSTTHYRANSYFKSIVQRILRGVNIKGTVSPDNVFNFKVYKFKSVLLVRPLMVFKLVYFVVL
jgi:hypothetical protein